MQKITFTVIIVEEKSFLGNFAMIDGRILTEKLLNYAKDNLKLSDYDVSVKRELLYYILKVNPSEPPIVKDSFSLNELKNELSDYVTENSIVSTFNRNDLVRFIMGNLLPAPSAINKKFRNLREKFGSRAACDYLYDLTLKGGDAEKDFLARKDVYYKSDDAEFYLFDRNEDFYRDGFNFPCTHRSVTFDLNGGEWAMRFIEPYFVEHESVVIFNGDKRSCALRTRYSAALDFVEYLPEYSAQIFYDEIKEKSEVFAPYFMAGVKEDTDVTKTPSFTASSALYPDVEISVYDYPLSVIRLQSFNRNTLESLAVDIAEKWLDYTDQISGVYGRDADGVSQNGVGLSVGYLKDNRYFTDIVLSVRVNSDEKSPDYSSAEKLNDSFRFGRILLPLSLRKATETAVSVLTKKTPVTEELFSEYSVLFGYEDTLKEIIAEYGFIKDAQKAENIFKKTVAKKYLDVLSEKSVFKRDDEGIRSFKRFLQASDVR